MNHIMNKGYKIKICRNIEEVLRQEVSYEFVRGIFSSFNKMLSGLTTRGQQRKSLHRLISKITINKAREIE